MQNEKLKNTSGHNSQFRRRTFCVSRCEIVDPAAFWRDWRSNRLNGSKIAKACSAATGLTSKCQDTENHPERQADSQRRSLPTIGMILDFFGNHSSNFTIVVNLLCSRAQIPRESSPPSSKNRNRPDGIELDPSSCTHSAGNQNLLLLQFQITYRMIPLTITGSSR